MLPSVPLPNRQHDPPLRRCRHITSCPLRRISPMMSSCPCSNQSRWPSEALKAPHAGIIVLHRGLSDDHSRQAACLIIILLCLVANRSTTPLSLLIFSRPTSPQPRSRICCINSALSAWMSVRWYTALSRMHVTPVAPCGGCFCAKPGIVDQSSFQRVLPSQTASTRLLIIPPLWRRLCSNKSQASTERQQTRQRSCRRLYPSKILPASTKIGLELATRQGRHSRLQDLRARVSRTVAIVVCKRSCLTKSLTFPLRLLCPHPRRLPAACC